jgi:hypothetical protein
MSTAYYGDTLSAEVLLGAGAGVEAVDNTVGCCMYVANLAVSTVEQCRVVHLRCLNSCFWSLWYIIYGDKAVNLNC